MTKIRAEDIHLNSLVYRLVAEEEDRQQILWGEQNHPNGTNEANSSLANAAKEACAEKVRQGTLTWADILSEEFFEAMAETDEDLLEEELIQVAAVAVSWVKALRTGRAYRE